MILRISHQLLKRIQDHGEASYPEEGAGMILGQDGSADRRALDIIPLANSRKSGERHNRYMIEAIDMIKAEEQAEAMGLDVIGVFHSHPDHPALPSAYDHSWALPWFSYIITSVQQGQAERSRSWRLLEDRSRFEEEQIEQFDVLEILERK